MLRKDLLKEVIMDQRSTILGKDPGIPRHALDRISQLLELPHVVVISGVRRCGKSTLLRQIIKEHYADEDFFYINFEDERLRDFDASQFNDLYEAQLSLLGKKSVFMVDEIQNVDGFEAFVRRFQDMGFKFFITGSNANLLSRELGTKLTGRHVRVDLQPFSFKEFLDMMGVDHDDGAKFHTESRMKIRNAFDEYLEKGGMPEFLRYGDQEILLRTYEDIILKDIIVRYGLENVKMVKDLYGYLISNLTNLFSFNSLKRTIGAGSTTTVQNYIHHLEEANFCTILQKYDHSIKKQMVASKKFYLTDHSFVRPVSTRLTRDRGKVLENIVFSHIRSRGEPFYYQNGGECDFIIVDRNEVVMAVQVTWEMNETTKEREVDGLFKAISEFDLDEGTIVTYDQNAEMAMDGKKINVVPAWKWLISY